MKARFILIQITFATFICLKRNFSQILNPCNEGKALKKHQQQFCKDYWDIVAVLMEGYKYGYDECQNAFLDSSVTGSRWNCTNLMKSDLQNIFFGVPHPRGKRIRTLFYVFFFVEKINSSMFNSVFILNFQ